LVSRRECPFPEPTGSDYHGGGGTVGAWRPQASASRTVIIDKERWFSSDSKRRLRKVRQAMQAVPVARQLAQGTTRRVEVHL